MPQQQAQSISLGIVHKLVNHSGVVPHESGASSNHAIIGFARSSHVVTGSPALHKRQHFEAVISGRVLVTLPAFDLLAPSWSGGSMHTPFSVPKVDKTAFITSRRLTVCFYRRASPAGSTQETPSSSVIRRAQLAAVMVFAVASTSCCPDQAAVLERQLIQWIQYLAGQTLSSRTDT
jgi:hypothetical protein